uniref:Saposin B-type domain-containing protein n=1 Tax=Plectus sambesii TaxID=2011161 RepID=A0A914WNB4_9BILA
MRLLYCVALVVIAVAFVNAQEFFNEQQDFDVGELNAFDLEEELNAFDLEAKPRGSVVCFICDGLMRLAKYRFRRSQKEIASALRLACKTVFKKKEQMCLSIVDKQMSRITVLLKTKLSPHAICGALKLCKKSDNIGIF